MNMRRKNVLSLLSFLGISCTFFGSVLLKQEPVRAQSCTVFVGNTGNGMPINVDICSIKPVSQQSADFVYYVGNDRVYAQVNCVKGTWFAEGRTYRPYSASTQRMLDLVCRLRRYSDGDC